MKKIACTFLLLFASNIACALPVGNPADASLYCNGILDCPAFDCYSYDDCWSLRIGFYGDYNYDRHMEVKSSDSNVKKSEVITNAGFLALNLFNRLDLFSTLGATNIRLVTPDSTLMGNLNQTAFIRSKTNFSWSVGAKATILECGCWSWGAEGQYFHSNPRIDSFMEDGVGVVYLEDRKIKYRDWQIATGLSYRINISCCSTALLPYGAITYSQAKMDMGNFQAGLSDILTFPNLSNNHDWGYALGLTLLGCNKASVTVEGRFISETAFYLNGQLRF